MHYLMSNSVTNKLWRTLLASAALHSCEDSWKSDHVETIQCNCPEASWKMPDRTNQKRSRSWYSCTMGRCLRLVSWRSRKPVRPVKGKGTVTSLFSLILCCTAFCQGRSCFASSSICVGRVWQEPCKLAVLGTQDHISLQKPPYWG